MAREVPLPSEDLVPSWGRSCSCSIKYYRTASSEHFMLNGPLSGDLTDSATQTPSHAAMESAIFSDLKMSEQCSQPQTNVIALQAPFALISPELLSNIFILLQEESDDSEEDDITIQDPPPEVVVSHVSNFWRAVALETQLLWKRIIIEAGRSLHEIETYLERSGRCFLDIRVRSNCNDPDASLHRSLDVVLEHINRWHSCSVESEYEDASRPLIARLAEAASPTLEYLSISVRQVSNRPRFDDSPCGPQILTGGCPRLKFLRLRGLAVHLFCPPLSTVTCLYLDHAGRLPLDYVQFYALLTSCPQLSTLSLDGDISGPVPLLQADGHPIRLPDLRNLRLCSLNGHVYSTILLSIEAPLLESLVLKGAQEHDLDPFFKSPHSSKFPHVRLLAICETDFAPLKYNDLFHSFPSIDEFTSVGNSPKILNAISDSVQDIDSTSVDHSRVPWPRLRTLGVIFNFEQKCLLQDVLEKRMKTGYALVTLRLGMDSDDDTEGYQEYPSQLQELVTIEVLNASKCWPCDDKFSL